MKKPRKLTPHLKKHLIKIADGEYTDDEIAKCMGFSDPDFISYVGTDKEDLDVTSERLEEIFSRQPDKSQLTEKEYKALLENVDQAMAGAQDDLNEFQKAAEILVKNKEQCVGNPNVETGDSPRKKEVIKELLGGKFNINLEQLQADLIKQGEEDRELF